MKEVWLKIKNFFDSGRDKRVEKSDQELIDLAEDYKVMMNMPSWKHFENELKIMFELYGNDLERNNLLSPHIDVEKDYELMKTARDKRQVLREVMYIALIAIGQGHHKEKERKQKGGENADTSK